MIMDRFECRSLLLLLAFLAGSSGSYCGNPAPNRNSLSPPLPAPSPTRGPNNANTGSTPPAGPTSKAGTSFCRPADGARALQRCVFPLEGYKEADYEYYDVKALEVFIRRVADYIEETETVEGCNLVSITASGYADYKRLRKILPWADAPPYCRTAEGCRKDGSASGNLTNDDLACMRECLVTNRIYSLLEVDSEISSNARAKLRTESHASTKPSEIGDQYRKVEITLERGGRCPDG